jgi:uncharacterized protein
MIHLRRRHAESVVRQALRESRVVVINGPRQAGKTTLTRLLLEGLDGDWSTLDSQNALDACLTDPIGFVEAHPKPFFIDEFQRGGDPLLRAIKLEVDRDPSRGQYVLSGSTRFLTLRTISESLAGRARIIDLWPYSQGEADELGPESDALVYRLFNEKDRVIQAQGVPLTRANYLERLCRGGYPEANELEPVARNRWFDSYLRTITQRDVPEISRGRYLGELPRLLRVLTARTGQELIVDHVSREAGIERTVLARNYLPLLETVYLTIALPSWSRNFTSRAIKHPKSYITDPGLAAHLLGVNEQALGLAESRALGPLTETFVVDELVKQVARDLLPRITLYHYRTRDQSEVDIIAEAADGRIVAIEVKAARTVGKAAFRSLAGLRDQMDRAGGSFVRGVVLYMGEEALPAGDRLVALSISHLWRPPAR